MIRLQKSFFLLKLLGILLAFLLVHRILFMTLFFDQFACVVVGDFVKAYLIGLLTDSIALLYFLLPTWLILLFFNAEKKIIRTLALTWFVIGFTVINVLNLSDLGYFPVTKKRMGGELLDILPEVPALLLSYLKDYWYLLVLLLIFILTAFFVFRNQLRSYKVKAVSSRVKLLDFFVVVFLFASIMRGGYGTRPFMPFDIPSLVDSRLQWLASNTPFQFIHTFKNETIRIETYFDQKEAEQIIGYDKRFKSDGFKKKNILFIILESFCSERVGLLSPKIKGYTPFMDSLLGHARTYPFGMANGRMTIDALPSILSGIPAFMEKNYCYSSYNNNTVHAISYLLESEGYNNAFFYGGLKTTFGFENFMNINFTKNYYDQEDYDNAYENSGWGVDDHLFLPFVAGKLKGMKQPFCASLLTLSLHHPFPVPEPYRTLLDSIKDPVIKSIRYTDLSLQLFFSKIQNEEWFKNSVIAISADHTSDGLNLLECNTINAFSVPISFIAVGDTAFNKMQQQSISQIDMYPTVLDYLGYDKPFGCLGKSAFSDSHATVQYSGNGVYYIYDHPYQLEYDNNTHKVNNLLKFNDDRTVTSISVGGENAKISDELTRQVKAYIQVFSYRINKNQF